MFILVDHFKLVVRVSTIHRFLHTYMNSWGRHSPNQHLFKHRQSTAIISVIAVRIIVMILLIIIYFGYILYYHHQIQPLSVLTSVAMLCLQADRKQNVPAFSKQSELFQNGIAIIPRWAQDPTALPATGGSTGQPWLWPFSGRPEENRRTHPLKVTPGVCLCSGWAQLPWWYQESFSG